MKNIICLLIFAFMLSCTAKKVITKTDVATKTDQVNAIVDTKTDQTKQTVTVSGKTNDNTEVVIERTEYDTSKLDSTGKPLIKSQTKTIKRNVGAKETTTTIQTNADVKTTHADNTKVNSTTEKKEESKVTPKTPAIAYWFYIIVIAGIVVGLFFGWPYIIKIKNIVFAILGIKNNSLT